MPDVPGKAVFLSEEDRTKAVLRVQENMTGIKNNKLKWAHVREALLDIKSWLLVLIQLCSTIPNGGVASVSTWRLSMYYACVLTMPTVWSDCHSGNGILQVFDTASHGPELRFPGRFRSYRDDWQHVSHEYSHLLDVLGVFRLSCWRNHGSPLTCGGSMVSILRLLSPSCVY